MKNKIVDFVKALGTIILVHQDDFSQVPSLLAADSDLKVTITTSDLRYTKGKNQVSKKNPDVVVYCVHSHEASEKSLSIINGYVKDYPVILIGERKPTKSLAKVFTCNQSFYFGSDGVFLLPKQDKQEVTITQKEFSIEVRGQPLSFKTAKGLFSYRGMDVATKILLNYIEVEPKSSVLDLACGYGAIGITLKKIFPDSTLQMIDSSFVATKYAQMNCELNQVDAEVGNSYLLSSVTKKFDVVVSNPPTHMAQDEAKQFFSSLRGVLTKNGRVLIVVNKAVDYEKIAKAYFSKVEIVHEEGKFKIVEIKPPHPDSL